jgi:hypothetical protein
MRSLIIAAAALAVATPAQALPIWAKAVARSECEYYAMGVGFPEALQQALRDNSHWNDEMQQAGYKISAKAIFVATYNRCGKLQQDAYNASKQDAI